MLYANANILPYGEFLFITDAFIIYDNVDNECHILYDYRLRIFFTNNIIKTVFAACLQSAQYLTGCR